MQVDSSVSDNKSQYETKQAQGYPEDGAVVLEPESHKETHVDRHEKHELAMRRRHPVLLEQLIKPRTHLLSLYLSTGFFDPFPKKTLQAENSWSIFTH